MRVQTSTFDASNGHSGGATIDLILKSGTNKYHGSAFGFMRDPDWSANWWDSNRAGQPKPDFVYRRWGFTCGGPVWLGPLYNGKDRTFFFYGFENWSSLAPSGTTIATVPRPHTFKATFQTCCLWDPNINCTTRRPHVWHLTAGSNVIRFRETSFPRTAYLQPRRRWQGSFPLPISRAPWTAWRTSPMNWHRSQEGIAPRA